MQRSPMSCVFGGFPARGGAVWRHRPGRDCLACMLLLHTAPLIDPHLSAGQSLSGGCNRLRGDMTDGGCVTPLGRMGAASVGNTPFSTSSSSLRALRQRSSLCHCTQSAQQRSRPLQRDPPVNRSGHASTGLKHGVSISLWVAYHILVGTGPDYPGSPGCRCVLGGTYLP